MIELLQPIAPLIDSFYQIAAESLAQFNTFVTGIPTNSEIINNYIERKIGTGTGIRNKGITKYLFQNIKYRLPHKQRYPTTNDLIEISNQNILNH